MDIPNCIFDKTPMVEVPGGLPEWMDPNKFVEYIKESRPTLWKFGGRFYTGEGVKKGMDTIKQNLHTFKCPKCGWVALFEVASK